VGTECAKSATAKETCGIVSIGFKRVYLPFREAKESGTLSNVFAHIRISLMEQLMIKLKQSSRPKDQIDLQYLLHVNDQYEWLSFARSTKTGDLHRRSPDA
jgi:hypothetical protein